MFSYVMYFFCLQQYEHKNYMQQTGILVPSSGYNV